MECMPEAPRAWQPSVPGMLSHLSSDSALAVGSLFSIVRGGLRPRGSLDGGARPCLGIRDTKRLATA